MSQPIPRYGVSVGSVLRRIRIESGFSEQAVVDRLKISLEQLEAIETNRWEMLPGQPFIDGMIRIYAGMLGINPEDYPEARDPLGVVSHQDQSFDAPSPDPVLSQNTDRREKIEKSKRLAEEKALMELNEEDRTVPWVVLLSILILGGLLYVWWSGRTQDEDALNVTNETGVSSPVVGEVLSASQTSVGVSESGEKAVLRQESLVASEKLRGVKSGSTAEVLLAKQKASQKQPSDQVHVDTQGTDPAAVVGESGSAVSRGKDASRELVVSVRQPSWISVIDAKGNRLIYQLLAPDETLKAVGELPYRVTIGQADGARLTLGGKPIEFRPNAGVVARLKVFENGTQGERRTHKKQQTSSPAALQDDRDSRSDDSYESEEDVEMYD